MSEVAFLGLGSNLGDRLAHLSRAVALLEEAGVRVMRSSRVWATDPIGGPPQPEYLNAVVEVRTSLAPRDLLGACHRIEADLGRTRDVRWGPRTVDLDVLLYDDLQVEGPDLTVPHPRMTERSFVILPLLELDPDPILLDSRRLSDLRLRPGAVGGARPFAPPLVPPR